VAAFIRRSLVQTQEEFGVLLGPLLAAAAHRNRRGFEHFPQVGSLRQSPMTVTANAGMVRGSSSPDASNCENGPMMLPVLIKTPMLVLAWSPKNAPTFMRPLSTGRPPRRNSTVP
jgi:hypothetical protein